MEKFRNAVRSVLRRVEEERVSVDDQAGRIIFPQPAVTFA